MGKKMACQAIDMWTISDLVGAFLDLAITYFLLCAATLTYIVSKVLGLFGLCLPCPCNGLFGNPSKIKYNNCLQSLLVDCPPEKISNVQFLVKTKFPFDSILNSELTEIERSSHSEHPRWKGEASCGSFSQGIFKEECAEEGNFDVKGKVVTSRSLRYGIRQRRNASADNDKSSSGSSFDPLLSNEQAVLGSPASVSNFGNEIMECGLVQVHMGSESPDNGKGAFKDNIHMPIELNESLDENKAIEKDLSSVQELNCDLQGELDLDGLDKNTIRVLEQALEEEHAASTALYLELEKERNAAATAADEAMSMILRLQEEKALIEMEARQYQRMIEEKSVYDAEEMNILKEILLRREREKHFLEKEVEAFRQIFCGIEQLDADMQDTASTQEQKASSFLYSSEDPAMMLQQISESIGEKKMKETNDFSKYEVTSIDSQNCTLPLGKELPHPVKLGFVRRHPSFEKHHQHPARNRDEIIQDLQELQEKEMLSIGNNSIGDQREVQRVAEESLLNHSTTQVLNVHGNTTVPAEEEEQTDDNNSCQGLTSKPLETCEATNIIPPCYGNVEKHGKDPQSLVFDRDLYVHDLHIVGEELNAFNPSSGSKREDLSKNVTLDIPISCDSPTINRMETETDIKRSKSDISSSLPHVGLQQGKALFSDLRRNSMSAFDYERLKIGSEVGWLTERLRIVQEGRDKLNFSGGHRDREKIQLQLLEDITSQLREIRQLTEPGKVVREVTLPPLSSKAILKKRVKRCPRSVSLGAQRSA